MNENKVNSFSIFGEFESKTKEHRFRQFYLHNDSPPTIFVIYAVITVIVLFIYNDFLLYFPKDKFYQLLSFRVLYTIFSIATIWGIKKAVTTKNPMLYDIICSIYIIIYSIFWIYINSTRPSNYFGNMILAIMGTLIIYVLIIIPLKLQLFFALTMTAISTLGMSFNTDLVSSITSGMYHVSFFFINILGFSISYQSNKLKRNQFTLVEKQEDIIKKLKYSNKHKNKMFSIISHDLRSPFNALLNYSELLNLDCEHLDTSEIKEMASSIYSSSTTVYTLLENLLSWTQIDLEKMPFEPHGIDLEKIILANKKLFHETSSIKNINIVYQNLSNAGTRALGDHRMIDAVIRNLLNNAIKFSKLNSTITIELKESDSRNLLVSIKDHGVGISPEVENKIQNEEFYTSAGTAQEQGTGIGLIIVREFIKKNKGTLMIKNNEDAGATFAFSIPKF